VNVFVGLLNLLPSPPFDGGTAVLAIEKIQSPVDMRKVIPVMAAVAAFIIFTVAVVCVDLVNLTSGRSEAVAESEPGRRHDFSARWRRPRARPSSTVTEQTVLVVDDDAIARPSMPANRAKGSGYWSRPTARRHWSWRAPRNPTWSCST
jgi:hypothetical protein